jgi:hypothetical protein
MQSVPLGVAEDSSTDWSKLDGYLARTILLTYYSVMAINAIKSCLYLLLLIFQILNLVLNAASMIVYGISICLFIIF